jgi:hypothetical protein
MYRPLVPKVDSICTTCAEAQINLWYSGYANVAAKYIVFLCFAGEEQAQRFLGNESHKDHFKLLEKDQNSLLVGAR